MINLLLFKDINGKSVAINPTMVSAVCEDYDHPQSTKIYFTAGSEDYVYVPKPFSEVVKAIRYAD